MAKLKGKEVKGFMVDTEGIFLTIKKVTGDFGLRLKALPENITGIYKLLTDPEIETQIGTMFNSFQVFIITCLQDFAYFHAFIRWNMAYWEKRGFDNYGNISVEENQKIIDEVEKEYEFQQEVKEGKHGEIS